MIDSFDEMLRYEEIILREMEIIKKQLRKSPKGKLRVSVNHGTSQYYNVGGDKEHIETYLSKKKDMRIIQKLAQKDYDTKLINYLDYNLKEINKIKSIYGKVDWPNVYSNLSEERKALVVPNVLEMNYAKEWQCVTYQGKKFLDNIPEIYTEKGERVRSKSEKMIADKMNLMGIPYRYEYPLKLKSGIVLYPDFTILNVSKRKEYLLEHLGMMDHPDYNDKAIKKINTYIRNGIFPGEKLLLTYETSQCSVDMEILQMLLEKYCL
ncbi:MAG: hypothetical protein ACI4DW_01970 [Lachnospiraceae bacterium]